MTDHAHGAGCGCGHHHTAADPHAARTGAQVSLTGQLVCADVAQMLAVLDHAQSHIDASRAEPGCLQFDLWQTDEPLVFAVAERFADPDAYRAHQTRTRATDWYAATADLERRGFDRRGLD
ncbi:putative quinol monooxygenase [Paracoccus luteus]|uniref:putative quinol monooxygenase n=1 Tax=Paracoccus luteus TaxID=2508543 RepID=UPI00106F88D6|nr:antibiotic biosynthesis monooxygenase [Paracoccus luteus]